MNSVVTINAEQCEQYKETYFDAQSRLFLLNNIAVSTFDRDQIFLTSTGSFEEYQRTIQICLGRDLKLAQHIAQSETRYYRHAIYSMYEDGFAEDFTLYILKNAVIDRSEFDEDLKWNIKHSLSDIKYSSKPSTTTTQSHGVDVYLDELINETLSAKITKFNEDKGFGFLEVPGSTDRIFVHVSDITTITGSRRIGTGDSVTFTLIDGKKGYAAINAVLN